MHPYTESKRKLYTLLIDGVKVARSSAMGIMILANQIRDKYPSTNIQIIQG
jgi:hypothetical protein